MKLEGHHIENSEEYLGLHVNNGVAQPPSVNPYLKKRQHRTLSVDDYVKGILKGDISILGQAVTLVESTRPEDHDKAQEVIEKCLPHATNSIRIGITGVPGAGKSTFIDALGMHLVENGHKLAVLAIDPSSERTKGSILGDKTRMEGLSVAENAFIRPSPSAGSLGGVARKTRETIVLCEAAGFDTIFVETVGVGQSETAVHSMVDFFLLIQLAGTGDELQGIKRGIMEMADGIAINKADGNNLEKANVAKVQFQNALHLFPMPESQFSPKVLTCSAYEKTGIAEVWQMVEEYIAFTKNNEYFDYKRQRQSKYWMYESINEQLRNHFYQNEKIEQLLKDYETLLLNDKISSFMAAKKLLDIYFEKE
jgi:LAO/AO transport system kinase